ncbi:DNA polymerase IV [Alicyclobacillus mengziensis]|uniref:DNA polymerase IV n=1 Tax=Alicyclobacillus mengziensis TaxID=2931921 RepID=A0A9X7Z719_9BACL|nr:DNA polymerase IV [Alicyclobacillus mengziensis]QSO46788.1 DNA polymerase IV [Alicyclobacillus mengziensis]
MDRERAVLHVDMNAFYCSCHAAAEPNRYSNRPTAVAGSPETRHGVVVTASYEARKLGVRATMTVAEALRAAPNLILIHPDFSLYREFSRKVFDIVRSFTPIVEVFSIDECFADVTLSWRMGTPEELAAELQARIANELSLPCSVGVSNNKFLAKMASDFKKPRGITVLKTEDIEEKLWPLSIGEMFGIGARSAERLNRLGIHTIGDLAVADESQLRRYFGVRGPELRSLANGIDDAPVQEVSEPSKSIGHSITLARDLCDFDELCTVLMNLADQVGRRVRRHHLVGRTVQITLRFATRKTITRSRTLNLATDLSEVLYETATTLLRENWTPGTPVRLLGVTLGQLSDPTDAIDAVEEDKGVQLSLFGDENGGFAAESFAHSRPSVSAQSPASRDRTTASPVDIDRLKRLAKVTDALRDKYGEDIVVRGRMLQDPESGQIRNRKIRGTSLQKDELSLQKDE